MGRIINEQRNLWGSAGDKSPNAQRADLWIVDFSNAVSSMNSQFASSVEGRSVRPLSTIEHYYVQSVTLPELKTSAEEFRRDSRAHMMPTKDEPIGEIRVKFMLDSPVGAEPSPIYTFMDTWRAFVRGGRGAYSRETFVPSLGPNFTLTYAFDVTLMLLRGNSKDGYKRDGLKQDYQRFITQVGKEIAEITGDQQKKARLDARLSQYNDSLLDSNSLLPCGIYVLEKAWLSAFKMSELNYAQGNQLVYLEATLYADNIVDLTV